MAAARSAGRSLLTDAETKQVLAAYGIPVVDTHASDRDEYELTIASLVDPQFGPVLLFGSGGRLRRAYEDRALALPPLNTTLARRMMEQTKIFAALQGARGGPPCDLDALDQLLVRFSQLIVDHRIREVEIDPLLGSREQPVAWRPASCFTTPMFPTPRCRRWQSTPTRYNTSDAGR